MLCLLLFSGILHARPHSWQSSKAKLVEGGGRGLLYKIVLSRYTVRWPIDPKVPVPSSLTTVIFATIDLIVASSLSPFRIICHGNNADLIVVCIVARSSSSSASSPPSPPPPSSLSSSLSSFLFAHPLVLRVTVLTRSLPNERARH